jgi:hypothetical protein
MSGARRRQGNREAADSRIQRVSIPIVESLASLDSSGRCRRDVLSATLLAVTAGRRRCAARLCLLVGSVTRDGINADALHGYDAPMW